MLTKVPCSALSPVAALSARKLDKVPQSLSQQAIELQNTFQKLKEVQSQKILSNSNLVISSINNPVSSPHKRTEVEDDTQLQCKSLFKDIEYPEGKKKKPKPIKQIDFSKSRIIRQTPKPKRDPLHIQLKQMQKQLKSDIAKLDREIEGEHIISTPFETKNKGHELYSQGLLMEDRKQFKQKIYEREKQLKEMEECTFQPKISQPPVKKNPPIIKQLSSNNSNNSTTQDVTTYLNKIEDKYQKIMQKAKALKKI